MCVAKNERGGPKRCSADLLNSVNKCSAAVESQHEHIEDLTRTRDELDAELQTLADMQAALAGTLSPEREQQLLAEARAYFDVNDPDPQPPTWQDTVVGQIAHVDQTWADAKQRVHASVMEPDAVRLTEISRYEQAVLRVGETIGAEADRRVAEHIQNHGLPEPDLREASAARAEQFATTRRIAEEVRAGRATRRQYLAERRRLVQLLQQQRDEMSPLAQLRAQTYREVLNEIRPLGGAVPTVAGRPKPDVVQQLRTVADDMPAEWIADINDRRPPLTLKRRTNVRASYAGGRDTIVTDGKSASLAHEFAHRIEEQHPSVWVATNEFLRRRTTNDDGTRELARRYGRGRSDERIRPDGFVEGYIGKTYPGPYTEVFSMGTEALFRGSFGGLVGDDTTTRRDLEHRNLMLGLFATAKAGGR